MMKEAYLYEKLDNQTVKCLVCNHYCKIANHHRGICGVRENHEGILYALNYGLTIAAAIDPIEKKPLYHFLPKTKTYSLATVGCNLKCPWCQNWEISQYPKNNERVIGENIKAQEHVISALKSGCESISYTYSEPTIFLEYAYDIMKSAHEQGLKNIWVSNGYMSKKTLDLITPLIDAMNIDLKFFSNKKSIEYCGCKTKPIIDNLVAIHKSGIHLEITTLIVPGVNDDLNEIKSIADFICSQLSPDVPWHLTRFFPHWQMLDSKPTAFSILEKCRKIGEKAGLVHVHLGNVR